MAAKVSRGERVSSMLRQPLRMIGESFLSTVQKPEGVCLASIRLNSESYTRLPTHNTQHYFHKIKALLTFLTDSDK